MWRIVNERVATLEEIERSWSLDLVLDENDALDAIALANKPVDVPK